ncbi:MULTISPECIES: TIM barrel protein [Tatumella]|uniref:Hydroxypyruvate isomerase family protein n=1 Tax=Tatumella punctata TaxID=399969 RepID=A0ABW1VL72_9GAMM|nr:MULTISPECIES: TIM barrel protein [unclassified Tatumella]MBS0856207.1 TIM barrel protein [Tatumella sp. JGM16]MBS0877561.1 TIM barrel protein [Tatumella sp. JGM82]MBS0891086.1 TIM barrel protein [Tatumella sp. JGM94]MBS0894528.1 TIM barrel protein [Tatumella sp. JGM130]MBS0902093.1 TIM barrel protein [Tatumella sp. JGM100]
MQAALRFCANLKWLFTELPFGQRFAAAAQAGFTAVEYAAPYDFPAADQRRWLSQQGLQLQLINTPVGPAGSLSSAGQACHPQRTNAFRRDIIRAINYASALSCPMIHVQAGVLPAGVTHQQAFDTLCENLQMAAGLAASHDITLLLEAINHYDIPAYFLQTQAESLAVIQQVNTGNLRLLFDIYHCQRTEGDVSGRLAEFWPWIRHIQVADTPLRGEPGSGDIDWPALFSQLRSLNYHGRIGCEYRPSAGTIAGLGWINSYR